MESNSLNIKVKKLIIKTLIYLFVVIGMGFFTQGTVQAAGFIDHNDSIYTEKSKEKETQDLEKNYNGEFDDADEPGILEQACATFVHAIGSVVHSLLKNFKLDIDTVILGRLTPDNNDSNLLRFEFSNGNVYSIFGMTMYSSLALITNIVLVLLVEVTAIKYMGRKTAQARLEAKNEFMGIFVTFIVIAMMPYLWDIAIFFRDLLMHSIKNMMESSFGLRNLSLWEIMDYAYEQSGKGFIPAALCTGSALLTVSFITDYLNIALSDTLLCIAFPFICINTGEKRKKSIEKWITMCVGNLAVPVADLVLVMLVSSFPLVLGNGLKISIVQLMLAWGIKKSRNALLDYLGVRTTQLSGLGGLMGMMAAGKLLRGAIGGVKSITGGISSAYSDYKDSKMEDELDSMSKKDEKSPEDRINDADINDEQQQEDEQSDEMAAEKDTDIADEEMDELRSEELSNELEEAESPEDTIPADDEQLEGEDELKSEEGQQQQDSLNDQLDENASKENSSPQSEIDLLQNENDKLAMDNQQLDKGISQANDDIHRNNNEIEDLKDTNSDKERQLEELISSGKGDLDRAQKLRNDIARNNQRVETLKARNAALNGEISSMSGTKLQNMQKMRQNSAKIYEQQQIIQSNSNYGSKFINAYNPETATPEQQRIHEIALKRANINNFDSPKFDGMLSHKEKADFYKKRARKTIIQTGTKSVGMASGAILGASAMSWMGPAYTAYGTNMGMSAGIGMGSGVGSVINSTINGVTKNQKTFADEANNSDIQRDTGTEYVPIKTKLSKGYDWEPVDNSNIPDFKPKEIINSIDKGGIFVDNSNSTLQERLNTSAEAVKLYELDAERKEKTFASIKKNIDAAIRNEEIANEDVTEYIQRRYSGGIANLSDTDKQKVQNFINEVVNYWKNN